MRQCAILQIEQEPQDRISVTLIEQDGNRRVFGLGIIDKMLAKNFNINDLKTRGLLIVNYLIRTEGYFPKGPANFDGKTIEYLLETPRETQSVEE